MPVFTYTAGTLPAWRFVPAAEAIELSRWDAGFNVHATHIGAGWRSVEQLGGRLSEGHRADRIGDSEVVLYRPSHLDRGVLDLEPAHLLTAPVRSPRAIGPGDVVVSKFLPPRVALISQDAPRHAPDGNCVRIIGLAADEALWVASVLDHPAFAATLSRGASGHTLPRVGARDLAELPLPPTPPGLDAQATLWAAAAEQRLAAQREMLELQLEAQTLADETAPPPPNPRIPARLDPADIPDTWAPDQAALLRYQRQLSAVGWAPLHRFLAREPARLREEIPPSRVLQLHYARGDLSFALPEIAPVQATLFRIYADPLRPDEVLMSSLGTAPKVVLNHPAAPATVWVSDVWARLDGGAVPGALALLLGVPQVHWQLARAATGVVRQIIGRGELVNVHIPTIAAPTAASMPFERSSPPWSPQRWRELDDPRNRQRPARPSAQRASPARRAPPRRPGRRKHLVGRAGRAPPRLPP
jgi:hypothetical protein